MTTKITKVQESGYNPDSAQPSKDCATKSESEPVVVEGSKKAMDVAARLGERWNERVKKEGKKVWYCPLSPPKERLTFPTKAKCQAFMNKEFEMRIAQAKLEKRPECEWTPQPIILTPTQSITDFVLPEHRERVAAAQAAAQSVQQLGHVSRSDNKYTAGVLVSMVESQAIDKVPGLDNDELGRCVHMAYFRSRHRLYKAAKAEAARRGLSTTV